MSNKYKYLFPFEKIPYGAKILIYGAGDVGMECYEQIEVSSYCKLIAFIDRAYDRIPKLKVPVYPPESVGKLQYDFVLVALKSDFYFEDIRTTLEKNGVDREKIVFFSTRNEMPSLYIEDGEHESENNLRFAYEKKGVSIALKFGPGLGDCVIKKKVVTELLRLSNRIFIDIYAPRGRDFIPFFYSDIADRVEVISDGGVLYRGKQKEYDLAISLFYIVEVDHYDMERIKSKDPDFASKVEILVQNTTSYGLHPFPTSQTYIHNARMRYRGYNYYTMYNYTGIVDIKDQSVDIPIDDSYKDQYKEMELGEYITFSYGNGASSNEDKSHVSKQWPLKYYEEYVKLFKKKYPTKKIVQIGDKNSVSVKGVDRVFFGLNLEIVKHILKNSILHLDIESGLVHVATQIGTKCIVLFGPTPVDLLGYPQNMNITAGSCQNCAGMYDNLYRCARDMSEPECMYSITPEIVMAQTDEYMCDLTRESVTIEEQRFLGKQNIPWKEVEEFLRTYIGKKAIVSQYGDEIIIPSDFPNEYIASRYSQKLRGALAKAKANASTVILGMVRNATNKRYFENKDNKHSKDAAYGWYRYDVSFRMIVQGEKEQESRINSYKGTIVVRINEKGLYLYDLINIKKEASTPF